MATPRTRIRRIMARLHSAEGNLAEKITAVSGSMPFVYFHVFWFGFWILANHGYFPAIPVFDPFPYGLLTMVVSLEAIFLSTFIMVAQNRQALIDTVRDIEEDIEQAEDERELDDVQHDLDELKDMTAAINAKLNEMGKTKS